jgi:hypothetical protein
MACLAFTGGAIILRDMTQVELRVKMYRRTITSGCRSGTLDNQFLARVANGTTGTVGGEGKRYGMASRVPYWMVGCTRIIGVDLETKL